MLSGEVQEIEGRAKYLVGVSVRASLNEIIAKNLGNKLRDQLAARAAEIPNKLDGGVYLVQLYERDPRGWTPESPFTQLIAKEVAEVGEVPAGMTTHTIPAGRYLRFLHQGPMKTIGASYDAMHAWLAKERRAGPCPYDFEYWRDASRLEEDDTEIAIHLPLGPQGRVGA